jgi:protein tyrosine phosphatase (PTP) superfamily phosphohydrolase (DUF442 family)
VRRAEGEGHDVHAGPPVTTIDDDAVSPAGATSRSTPTRTARIMGRVLVGFIAFLLVGNGLILASTAWFKWTSPGVGAPVAIDNITRVDERLYRGGAPGARGLRELAGLGVTTVVDLRAEADLRVDDALLDELGMTRFHLPIRDGQLPDEAQTARFLDIVERSDGAVFLHCGAGVGRTGAMSAFYLNATGQAEGTGAVRRILAVGPPSLEQITFAVTTAGGEYDKPNVAITALSRVLDGPRRIWHNVT